MILEDMTRHLAFLGLGTIPDMINDGDLFYGLMPEKPDQAVCLMASDAAMPGAQEGARLQLIVRALTVREATQRMQWILDRLDGFDGFLAGDGPKALIRVESGAHGLGVDDKRRPLYSANLRVWYCG